MLVSPAITRYLQIGMDVGTPSVDSGLVNDLYVTLEPGASDGGTEATIRAFVKPLILWMWLGGAIMAVGTLLAAFPGRRQRRPTEPVSAPVPHLGRIVAGLERITPRSPTDTDFPRSRSRRCLSRGVAASPRSWRSSSPSCVPGCSSCSPVPTPARRRPPTPRCSTGRRPTPSASWPTARRSTSPVARAAGSCSTSSTRSACRASRSTPSCVAFDEQERSLGNDGAELVTVVFRDDRDGVAEFFADEGGDWPVVYDDDGSIATAFGVTLVPETWIVDPNGIVRWRTISPVTADQLDSVIDQLSGREA